MREHLYQGKDTDNGKWVQGDLVTNGIDYTTAIRINDKTSSEYGQIIKVDPETVSEFTGQRDINKKRIFEGNIVQCIYLKNTLCLVEFENYDLQFKMRKIGDKRGKPFNYYGISTVVIGNKWDNPELLKEV